MGSVTGVLVGALSLAPATTVFGLDEATTTFLLGLASALLGAFVAWTAYRGYRRNESRPMLFLAVGVVFLTTIPFVLAHVIDQLTAATDATVLLAITVCHLVGLVAVVTSLRRPDRA